MPGNTATVVPHEFELSIPRPAEDPQWIEKALAGLQQATVDVAALLARQQAARDAAWQRFRARYPRKEMRMRRRIERWAAVARDREAARSETIRAFWVLRAFVLRAGALTGQGERCSSCRMERSLSCSTAPRRRSPSFPPGAPTTRAMPRCRRIRR